MVVSSFTILAIVIRSLRLLTEKFTSFGALFETIGIALKDLLMLGITMLIIFVGFMIAFMIISGPIQYDVG